MKEDEKKLLIDIYSKCRNAYLGRYNNILPINLIESDDFYINQKRAYYILEKWCNKDWYEYGISLRFGWLTPLGLHEAKNIMEE